jgi:hypothetical protein
VYRFVNYEQNDRREMTNSLPETPNSLTGGCMCGASALQDFGKAGCRGPVSLQPMPTAIRERIFDGHNHQALNVPD